MELLLNFAWQPLLAKIALGNVGGDTLKLAMGESYRKMLSTMIRRQWCRYPPFLFLISFRMTVLNISFLRCDSTIRAEYKGLFEGGKTGMDEVVEFDASRYDIPFFVWTRWLLLSYIHDPGSCNRACRQKSSYTGLSENTNEYCLAAKDACDPSLTGIANPARDHPDGVAGWQCVGFKVTLHESAYHGERVISRNISGPWLLRQTL